LEKKPLKLVSRLFSNGVVNLSAAYLYLKQFGEGLQALFLTQKEFFICLPFQAAKKNLRSISLLLPR
jgi:hypothetical protein